MDMRRLIICIVCYNNEKEVVEYVKQIKEQNYKKINILICCNSSIDDCYLDYE